MLGMKANGLGALRRNPASDLKAEGVIDAFADVIEQDWRIKFRLPIMCIVWS
jgi:hypothetical protein